MTLPPLSGPIPVDTKFGAQLSGDWNEQVMAGKGPWTSSSGGDGAAASFDAKSTSSFGMSDATADASAAADALSTPFGRALELAEGDPELMEMLGELEVRQKRGVDGKGLEGVKE